MGNSDIAITIIITTLLILLLIAGIVVAFFVISRQRTRQKAELFEAELKYEQELRSIEIEVVEQLRGHIARELHDHLGHQITCMRLTMENQKLDYPELEELFEPLNEYITEASQQVRMLSRSLNKDYVSELNLNESINLEIEKQIKLGFFNIHWTDEYNKQSLDKNQELIVFRIFQEVINNALKHSKGQNLTVLLTDLPQFFLMIKDDGRGFDLDEMIKSSNASGLRNITKRAEMAGLACEIITAKNQGCEYRFGKLINLEES